MDGGLGGLDLHGGEGEVFLGCDVAFGTVEDVDGEGVGLVVGLSEPVEAGVIGAGEAEGTVGVAGEADVGVGGALEGGVGLRGLAFEEDGVADVEIVEFALGHFEAEELDGVVEEHDEAGFEGPIGL